MENTRTAWCGEDLEHCESNVRMEKNCDSMVMKNTVTAWCGEDGEHCDSIVRMENTVTAWGWRTLTGR